MNVCSCLCLLLTFATAAAAQAPARTISGTITSVDGAPARGIRVAAIAIDFGLLSQLSATQTDPGGAYALKSLPPGRYLVAAGPADAITYYPGVAAPASARAIIVGLGGDVADVNFALVAQPRFTIAGRLRSSAGSVKLPAPRVALGGSGGTDRRSDVAADGSFAFADVASGTYSIQ